MGSESIVIAIISNLGYSLPIFLVCLIGAIFIKTRPLAKNTKFMGITGLVILMLESALGFVYRLVMFTPSFIDNSSIGFFSGEWLFRIYSVFSTALYVMGVIFLIIAVCTKTDAGAKASAPAKNPYQL
jgi:hypothetical protein